MNWWVDGRMGDWMDEFVGVWMDECAYALLINFISISTSIHVHKFECDYAGWVDGWIDGQRDGQMDGGRVSG